MKDTAPSGSRVGAETGAKASKNGRPDYGKRQGRASGTFTDGDGPDALAEWMSGTQWAHELDVDIETAIGEVLGEDTWKEVRKFCFRYGRDPYYPGGEGMAFADFDALPREVWYTASPQISVTRRQVAEFSDILLSDDPHDIGKRLKRERWERFNERDRVAGTLKRKRISPATEYPLSEVARVAGEKIADSVEQLIERNNLRAWEAPPPRPKERAYLVTAAEMVGTLGVPVALIATMTPATDADRDTAVMRLAKARKLHRDTLNTPDDGGEPLAEVIRHVADMVNDPPTGVMVNGLVYEEMVIHWIGDGGTYKTFTVLDVACSVAAGRNVSGQLTVPEKRGVLFLCAERRHHGLIGDIRAWCQHNQIGLDQASLHMHGWDDVVQLVNRKRMRELTAYVVEHGIRLVVIDTQSMATTGLEENSATAMNTALANAKALARTAKAAVIVVHHTARKQDHARGSTVWRDNTDATVLQKVTGPMEAEFTVDKHKSVESGTHYPVKVEKVVVSLPPTGDEDGGVSTPGGSFTTLVACPRDPFSEGEQREKMHSALTPDQKILVAVVNDNEGPPLSPAQVQRKGEERGYTLKKDATARHLKTLAKYRLIAETIDIATNRRTYSKEEARQDGGE